MTIFLCMLIFLVASMAFYFLATRDSSAYAHSGGLVSPRSWIYAIPLIVAALACLGLTVLPPKGFHDLSLRYMGLDMVLAKGGEMVVGGDLEAGHFLSGVPGARGAIFTLENRDGALWIAHNDTELSLQVDGGEVDGQIEVFAVHDLESGAVETDSVTVTVGTGRNARTYSLQRLPGDVSSARRLEVTVGLRYGRPITEPIHFPPPDPDASVSKSKTSGVLLLTNRQSASAHDELRLPVPPPAGPVIAKIEPVAERRDAVLLITPEDRLILEVGTTAKVAAQRSQRWVVLRLTDQTILDPVRMRAFLLVLFVPHLLLLLNLLATRRSPAAIVVYLVALALLSFRLVLGVRAASLYPYHYEALALSLSGLILLPLYVVALTLMGPVAGGIAGVPGRLGHPGGRRQMVSHLMESRGLWELLVLTVLTAVLMGFVPTSLAGERGDVVLIVMAVLPFGLFVASVFLRRFLLRSSALQARVGTLGQSPSLFAHLVEVDAIRAGGALEETEVDPEKQQRAWLMIAAFGAAWATGMAVLFFIGPEKISEDILKGGGLLGILVTALALFRWARVAGHLSWLDRGRVATWRRKATGRLEQRESLGHVLRQWWFAPAGRMSMLVTGLVVAMIAVGRRETLFEQPRLPLMLIYTFLFLAMATANMVFIAKKAGRENFVANLLIIGGTLIPLMLYSAYAHDYGSAIAMSVPLLAVMSFALLRSRGSLALLSLFLLAVFFGAPGAYFLGGDYLQYRVITVLRGPSGLETEVSRTAQNTLEQTMQMRFYSTAGDNWLFGRGYGGSEVSRGLRLTSLNDNVFSVFVLSELGTAVGAVLGLIYALLLVVIFHRVLWPSPEKNPLVATHSTKRGMSLAQGGMLFGLCLTVVFIASYMMAANIGMAPLTGKNLPFLGLNSKSDLIQHLVLFGLMVSMLLKGLSTPAVASAAPVQMGLGDRIRLRSLRAIGAVLILFSLTTAGWTLFQWFNKPDEVIRFAAYNGMLQRLAAETNDFNRRDEAGLSTPGEEPPLKLYRNDGGALQMEIVSAVIAGYYPDFGKSLLLRHAQEFNRTQREGGRSIFRLRRVSRTGNPAFDYDLRVDANYMKIVSPFRRQPWRGEILARERKNTLTLASLGSQSSILVNDEAYMGAGRTLRLKPLERQMLIERVDDQRGQSLDFKVNGFHFAKYHSFRPPPKFLVLREDDFVRTPRGVYLVTYNQDRMLSKVKTVNGKLERAYPEGESFYYAANLGTSVSELARLYGLGAKQGSVRLTLDADLNRQIHEVLKPLSRKPVSRKQSRNGGLRRVAVTVMDLASGDLLVLGSAPAVDPNLPELARPNYRQILYENHNLRTHPMGSAIKPLFAAAAVHAAPELVDLKVLGNTEKMNQILGLPFDVQINSGGGAETLGHYLERSSNSYQFYLSTLALAAGDDGKIIFSGESFQEGYDLSLGKTKLTKKPDFGGRLVVQGDSRTRIEKLDETPFARSFQDLFDIGYSSEVSTYVEPQLWQPYLKWLESTGLQSSDGQSLAERMSVEASLPDRSLIAFDRMTDLRLHFLSTTLGGAEGRLHNVRVAEIFARLATGKKVNARLLYPVEQDPVEQDPAKPVDYSLTTTADLALDETARREVARGLSLVFSGVSGTARPKSAKQKAIVKTLTGKGLRLMGKTGTHVDIEKGDTPVTDSILAAVVGMPENSEPGSRVTSGLAIVIYMEDTVQHRATELFYELLPMLGEASLLNETSLFNETSLLNETNAGGL